MVCLQQCSRATLIKICVDLFNQKMTSLTGLLDQEVHLLLLLGQVQMPLEMVNNFIWNTFMFVHFQLSIRQHCFLFNQTKVLFNICVAHLHNDTIWMGLRNLGNAIEYYEFLPKSEPLPSIIMVQGKFCCIENISLLDRDPYQPYCELYKYVFRKMNYQSSLPCSF